MAFDGCSVLAFESRRALEIAELIRLNGGVPFVAPALQETPIAENQEAFRFADEFAAGHFDMVILLTGVGTRYLGKLLDSRDPEGRFAENLRRVAVVVRGPKPAAVMREWNVPIAVSAPEPNTWREVLTAVAVRTEKRIAVQEYGRPNEELLAGLRAQGRQVTSVPVYQWQLPSDLTPMAEALDGLQAGRFQVSLFTTGVQIDHFLQFAESLKRREEAVNGLRKTLVASIGPDCSEALRGHGIEPALEPSHSKMGLLVREAGLKCAGL